MEASYRENAEKGVEINAAKEGEKAFDTWQAQEGYALLCLLQEVRLWGARMRA